MSDAMAGHGDYDRRFGRRLAGSADDFDFTVHVITLVVSKPVDGPPASIPAPIG